MTLFISIGQMLAGIAIFLLGMSFMEESLRSLAGRRFKLFLRKHTSNKLKAVGGGAVVTALLQSSSIANLLLLSLVGAGVIQMQNALAVILGSNLGTTLSNWLVATLGFKFNITNFIFPLAGITGISLAFFRTESRWYQWSRFLLGFSFLFIGLGFIKEAMEDLVNQTDLSRFIQYPLILFFGLGIVLTTIIQSSSATVALTLSALYVNAIPLPAAMAIVVGSEVGTTIKLFLAAAKGPSVKKRVALGNFLINSITALIVFFLVHPLHHLITDIIRINDKLLALVFFQSVINLVGILLFYPFLKQFGNFLEKRFKGKEAGSFFINKVPVADTELAGEALEKETRHFIFHVLAFSADTFETSDSIPGEMMREDFKSKKRMEKYEYIKDYHGEIHLFYAQLRNTSPRIHDVARFEQLSSAVRNSMYAAKNIRDAFQDIEQLRNSSNDAKYNFYLQTREEVTDFFKSILSFLEESGKESQLENISDLYKQTQDSYTKTLQELYKEGMAKNLGDAEISTLINFNREIYTAFKSLIFALKDYLLEPSEADKFDELPGFIR